MKKYLISCLSIFLLLIFSGSNAQELLSLQDAVKIALERNYDIRIGENLQKISKENINPGAAGMLPSVTATFNNNNSIMDTRQTQLDGTVRERNGAKNSSLNYGVGLDWTIFNGFKMFASLEHLKQLERLGESELKLRILTTVGDVISGYFDLAQQQQVLKTLDSAIAISQERVRTAEARYQIGKASKLEVLNAQVDLNSDTTLLLRQKEIYAVSRITMNELMARDPAINFIVLDEITIDRNLILPQLQESASRLNPSLKSAVIQRRISELLLRQVKAERYPTIALNGGYTINSSRSALGFATQSNSNGFTYGVSASFNIFNGFLQNRAERIAKINMSNVALEMEQVNQRINSQLTKAFQTYLTNNALMDLEKKNEEIARQNLQITLDKYKIGSISSMEFRDAQLNYLNARSRYINSQFQAKLSEITLKEIAGIL